MDRFQELEIFVAIARTGSISRAAEQLRLAKSAVSKRLSDLETRLGVQLMNRTTRKLVLTDAGSVFLARAQAILNDLAEAETTIRHAGEKLVGRLRIAAPLSFGLSYLRPVLSRFIRENPELNVEVDFSDRKVNLVEEGFDVAVRIGVLTDSSLIARKIMPIAHVAAAAPGFWDIHGRPETPDDLMGLDCMRYLYLKQPDVIPWWGPDGTSGSITPPVRMLTGNGEFIASMAVDGCGFVVEPEFILSPFIEQGQLEAVLTDYAWSEMNLFIVFPPTRHISARVRAFADAVIERFST